MHVKGNHEFQVSREKLWEYLMDVEVLAKITPGISKLEKLENDNFKSYSEIKIGPIKSTFIGKMQIVNKDKPASFLINMEQLSRVGNVNVAVQMNLEEKEEGGSVLTFEGKAKLSKILARMGNRVLSGAAKILTREIFSALEKHIKENQTAK